MGFFLTKADMSNFAQQLKVEIGRLAKKEARSETKAIKTVTAQYRSDLAGLKKRLSALEAQVRKLQKAAPPNVAKEAKAAESTGPALRFRSSGFASLRRKLGLSVADMAQLVGVSAQSIYHWEAGKSKPRAAQLQAIARIRKMGKKAVAAELNKPAE